jgi:hypothetical protein
VLTKGVQILAHSILFDHIALRQKRLNLVLHLIRQSVSRALRKSTPDEVVQGQSDEELAQSLDTLLLGASASGHAAVMNGSAGIRSNKVLRT